MLFQQGILSSSALPGFNVAGTEPEASCASISPITIAAKFYKDGR